MLATARPRPGQVSPSRSKRPPVAPAAAADVAADLQGGTGQPGAALHPDRQIARCSSQHLLPALTNPPTQRASPPTCALTQELERGELSRWPRALYGRTQLVRYARAAGLDPDRVVGTVMPLLDQPAPADLSPEPPRPSASGSEGRIAIIASSFDKDEELFASDEAVPQEAAARPITTTAAPAREEAARAQPGIARLRPPIAPRPRRTARIPVTGARRARPSRTPMLALAISAALLCGAALWSYGPRPQLTTEVRVEHPNVIASPAPAVPAPRPQAPPAAEAPTHRTPAGTQRTADARTPQDTPAVVAPPAAPAAASP